MDFPCLFYEDVHKVSFHSSASYQIICCVKRLRVRDRVMSHDAYTRETSQGLTVASLQRLKMNDLIPAPQNVKCGL